MTHVAFPLHSVSTAPAQRGVMLAGAAAVAGLGYALGCWLARETAFATRQETAALRGSRRP